MFANFSREYSSFPLKRQYAGEKPVANGYALLPVLPLFLPPASARLHAWVFALILAHEERKIETGGHLLRSRNFLVTEQRLQGAQVTGSLQ